MINGRYLVVGEPTGVSVLAISASKERALLRTVARPAAALGSRILGRAAVDVGVLESATRAESAASGGLLELAEVVAAGGRGRGITALGAALGGRGAARRGGGCSGRGAAGELGVHLGLEGAVDAAGVLAGGDAAGLAAVAAVLEALAAGAVAALGEPELARKRRQLTVLGGNSSLGNESAGTGGTTAVSVALVSVLVLLLVATVAAGAVHTQMLGFGHFPLIVVGLTLAELLIELTDWTIEISCG